MSNKNPICPKCKSTTHKHGETASGNERFRCSNKNCKYSFVIDDERKTKGEVRHCPNCKKKTLYVKNGFIYESEIDYKNKKPSRQRFKCKVCKHNISIPII